jgi:hypothetical protein
MPPVSIHSLHIPQPVPLPPSGYGISAPLPLRSSNQCTTYLSGRKECVALTDTIFPRGKIYWYKFYFAGQLIRESSKSTSKTVAKNAESQRRRELEQGFNNVQTRREIRIRQLRDVAEDYLGDYRLRFRGVTFAEYAIGHVVRHLGEKLLIDIDETTVVVDAGEVDLCLKDPGHEVNVHLSAELRAMVEVWMGRQSLGEAMRAGKLSFEGSPRLVSSFRKCLMLSPFARAAS